MVKKKQITFWNVYEIDYSLEVISYGMDEDDLIPAMTLNLTSRSPKLLYVIDFSGIYLIYWVYLTRELSAWIIHYCELNSKLD